MNTLEHEIMEKFRQLQPSAKRRIRALIDQETSTEIEQPASASFDYAGWLRNVEALRQQIRANQNEKQVPMDVIGMLRDIRDGEDE